MVDAVCVKLWTVAKDQRKAYLKNYLQGYMPIWRERRREEAKARLGGKCAKCGSRDSLEFDHQDPASKLAPIGKLWTASKARFELEIVKCQLLCKPCHIEKTRTNGEQGNKQSPVHGSYRTAYVKKCPCNLCAVKRLEHSAMRRQRRKDNKGG